MSRKCAQINLNNKNKSYNRSDYRFDDASRGAITIKWPDLPHRTPYLCIIITLVLVRMTKINNL